MSPVKEWSNILRILELKLSSATVKTWFYKTELLKGEAGDFEITFPNYFSLDRVKSHYLEQVVRVIDDRLGLQSVSLKLTLKKIEPAPLGPLFEKELKATPLEKTEVSVTKVETGLPLPNLKSLAFGLSPFYTLDQFVVGPNNNLAYHVALSVVENPGHSYNPFFLYGTTGLGKTHLMQAVGNEIIRRFPQKKVVYATGEAFTNELLESIQHRTQKRFRDKFRNTDVLLIDDVQFVAGKEATQEELFHAFNDLYLSQKQILLTSDRPPRDMPLLEGRLKSRFAGGMMADIQAPDETMRAAILRNKRDRGGFNVNNEIIDFIAGTVKNNIREMEGVFLQIVSVAKTRGEEVSLGLTTEILSQNSLLIKTAKPTPKKILLEVEALFSITHKDLVGPRRTKNLIIPRQICMYLLRHLSNLPLMSVGEILGGRDHTTIMHGVEKVERACEEGDEGVIQKVNALKLNICG